MYFYLSGVEIDHSYQPASLQRDTIESTQFCSYHHVYNTAVKDSILSLANSSACPPLNDLSVLFKGPVTGCGVMTILSCFVMVIWFYYRSTFNGIKRLFQNQCCTQMVSLFISAMILGFASPGFAVFVDQFNTNIWKDFGANFWGLWGCQLSLYSNNLQCGSCQFPQRNYCNTNINQDTGFIIGVSNFGFIVLFCVYSWIGSWCCPCCCPGFDPEILPTKKMITNNSSVDYTGDHPSSSSLSSTALTSATGVGSYTLYVHHGAQFPTKIVVNASTLSELEVGIRNNLDITMPFRIAVFDDVCQQYVLVTSLTLVPPQATIQLLFS